MIAKKPRFDVRESSGIIFLLLGVLLLANVVVSVIVIRPKLVRYRQLTDLSSPQLQVVATREKDVVEKEDHRKALEKARDDMKHLAGDVLSTRQRRMIGVQLEVAKLAREYGIALDRVQYVNEPLDNGALERFAIVVPLAGGYSNLRKFIQSVESSDNFLVIEKVALGERQDHRCPRAEHHAGDVLHRTRRQSRRPREEAGRSGAELLMPRAPSRREWMLIAGLVGALSVWLWHAWGTEEPQAVANAAKKADARKELALGTAPVVHMDLLQRAVVRYDQAGRDLFKYSVRPPSWAQVKQMRAAAAAAAKAQREAEERARLAELQRQKEEAERQIYLAAHPVPPPPPQPPAIPFKFLGFVGPPNGRIAAFEENDRDVRRQDGGDREERIRDRRDQVRVRRDQLREPVVQGPSAGTSAPAWKVTDACAK